MFKALHNSLLSLFYPQECRVCSQHVDDVEDGVACAQCWSATRMFDGSQMLCARCGAFFNDTGVRLEVFCRKCDDHHYDKAIASGIYEKALAATIIDLKTKPILRGRARTAFLATFEHPALRETSLIVPIPLSPKRYLERGFNQADVLGEILASESGLSLDRHSLVRKVHSPIHRIAMDKKARELTVRNAFEVKRPKLIEGRTILLVDDVFTSGATSSHCAKILKKNGAAKVNVLTLARAVMH